MYHYVYTGAEDVEGSNLSARALSPAWCFLKCTSNWLSSSSILVSTNTTETWKYLFIRNVNVLSVQFSSVTQSCPTLCNPMNCSMPGLPVHHQLPEFTQTHVHRVGDAIQPSHPLLSPSPPAPNPSQHQSLFQ